MTPPTPSAAAPLEVTDESVEPSTPSSTPKGSESRSPGRLAWKRFKRDRTGVISAYIVIFFFMIAICAPLIAKLYGKDPYTTYASQRPELLDAFSYPAGPNGGMSSEFWFGIEPQLGRDVFTFLLYGIRTSLLIASACVAPRMECLLKSALCRRRRGVRSGLRCTVPLALNICR